MTNQIEHWEIVCRGAVFAVLYTRELADAAWEVILKQYSETDLMGFTRFHYFGNPVQIPPQPGSMEEMIHSVLHQDE